jgi:lipopolysaccharide assembly outer membrane protein LptD (OstA)
MKTMTWLKIKFAVGMGAAVLLVGGVGTVAISQTTKIEKITPQLIKIQTKPSAHRVALLSNGAAIAELIIPKGTMIEIKGGQSNFDINSGTQTAKGNVTIQLTRDKNPPVIVKADEIIMTPEK